MKSAYEIAMEKLGGAEPVQKLTDEQRAQLAEIDSVYKAKLAEREIFITNQLEKAHNEGDFEAISQLEKQRESDRKSIEAERDAKKEKVRKN